MADNNFKYTNPKKAFSEALKLIEVAGREQAIQLDLSNLGLAEVPQKMGELKSLKMLFLDGNQLTSVPESLGDLKSLELVSFHNNQLTSVPESLGELKSLEWLSFTNNRLTSLPNSMAELKSLRNLYLTGNQITIVPEWLGQLKCLQHLYFSGNQLTSLPECMSELKSLNQLYLNSNWLKSVPEWLGELKSLQELKLNGNQLTNMPESLVELKSLQKLDLSDNQLTSVSKAIGNIPELQVLDLGRNPLLHFPPQDVVELGVEPAIRYLRAATSGEETVWESKALIVGDGNVGKTWLYEALNGRLKGGNRQADNGTVGIEIGPLMLNHPERLDIQMKLHCWDFSGQAVNHATHQFFFSQRSLFILCWSARAGWEAGHLRRWLNNIRDRAPGAKILLVATQWDAPHADYPEKDLLRDYPQIIRAHRVSSDTGEGIAGLKADIAAAAAGLPLMGVRWPASWRRGAQAVVKLRSALLYCPLNQVLKVMELEGLSMQDASVLLRWLHELGEVLHFASSPNLMDLVMLDPQWVTKRVGEILASREVEEARGILTRDCLTKLWPDLDDHIRQHLLRMMDVFDLAYRIPEDFQERSVVVEKLPQNQPEYESVWKTFADHRELRLRFQLKAMHPGIPTWLIARCHRFTQDINWLRGALFGDQRKSPRHLALVCANDEKRVVDFAVRGPFPPTLMTLLVDGFLDTVQRRYPGLEMERLVPCPGPGGGTECKHYFKQTNLENRLTSEKLKLRIECEECGTEHEVAKLLFGLSLLPAVEAITNQELQRVVAAEGDKTRAYFDQGLAAMKEFVQLQFIKEWNTQQLIEEQSCPTVFSLYSLDGGTLFRAEKLRLQLYCMKPGCWHTIGKQGQRDFAPPKEWAQGTLKFLKSFATMLRPATIAAAAIANPAAGAALFAGTRASDFHDMREQLDATAKLLEDWEKLSIGQEHPAESLISDSRAPSRHEGVDLYELKKFLGTLFKPENENDPPEFGLKRVRTPEDHVLWLCPEHAKEYR